MPLNKEQVDELVDDTLRSLKDGLCDGTISYRYMMTGIPVTERDKKLAKDYAPATSRTIAASIAAAP